MADSCPCSNCADAEDCSSGSNLSLSVGYYPDEDSFSCEDTSPSGPSSHLVSPFQGSQKTESIGGLLGRQSQIQDDPEQFCKLSITLAWDVDTGCNHSDSVISWDLHGDNQWTDKYPQEKAQLTLSKLDGFVKKLEQFLEKQKDDEDDKSMFPESAQKLDFQLSSCTRPDVAQASHQGHDTCHDLPMFHPPQNEDVIQFPQIPLRPQEHELAETVRQATGRQRTSTKKISPISSDQPEEEDTHSSTQALSFLKFRRVFRWLRQQVLSSFGGREHPKKATKYPLQLTQKKRLSLESKGIQLQEYIE
uniref:Uncharacterized protein n=1 Tax=Molossus molossus TaxID=27622 RepID=A0A7J8FVU8_MOLMO|nr:hypothetical protein HJG59_001690 [Molossus molossus]